MYGSGDVFEGLWLNDLKHGEGTYFYMNRGKRFDGVWQEGTCVANKPLSWGSCAISLLQILSLQLFQQ